MAGIAGNTCAERLVAVMCMLKLTTDLIGLVVSERNASNTCSAEIQNVLPTPYIYKVAHWCRGALTLGPLVSSHSPKPDLVNCDSKTAS